MTQNEKWVTQLQTDYLLSQERLTTLARDVADLKRELAEARKFQKDDEVELTNLREKVAVLTTRLDEYVKKADTWDGRRWALFMAVFTLISGVISGLIVSFVRRP